MASIYALYPATFDGTTYLDRTAPPGAPLQHGGAYAATLADGATPAPNTSYSALGLGETAGFGADYALGSTPGLELPGSGGVPATLGAFVERRAGGHDSSTIPEAPPDHARTIGHGERAENHGRVFFS